VKSFLRITVSNLLHYPLQTLAAVGGIGLALSLALTLEAIVAGAEEQFTRYIDRSGADVFISQSGVRNMHMATSTLAASLVPEAAGMPGVRSATGILYATSPVTARGETVPAYVIGLPERASSGGPGELLAGESLRRPRDLVLSKELAARVGGEVGQEVRVFNRLFRLVGIAAGTGGEAVNLAFIPYDDFRTLRRSRSTVSFILVASEGESAADLAKRLEARFPGETVQTREAFSASERRIIADMTGDVTMIMAAAGFLVGLMVTAVTVYSSVRAQWGEFAALKAIGASAGQLTSVVLSQALALAVLGFLAAVATSSLLALIVPTQGSGLSMLLTPASLMRAATAAALTACIAAAVPAWRVAKAEPAIVFGGRPG
jgi:putative ABC transport system permease protein